MTLLAIATDAVTQQQVDRAWNHFSALAAQLSDNQRLLGNRRHMEELAKAESDWKAIFLAFDRQQRATGR